MSPFFFQKYWDIVGPNVIEAVLSVIHSGYYLQKMNFTNIVLIPKKKKKKRKHKLCLITTLLVWKKVVSRIVSKVIANRLKTILPNVISDAQSAFVPNRLITNNTTVAFEVLHRMQNKRRGKRGLMAVKLDISKAYARVEWAFLQKVMLK